MRSKSREEKENQGTFEPSKQVDSVELQEWDGARMPAASSEWPPNIQELWNLRCRELAAAGYLMKASLPHLKRYCFAIMMAEEAERNLISGGFVVDEEGTQGQVYKVVSKWMTVLEKANKSIDTIGAKFGFTPLDASKIPAIKKMKSEGENLLE